MHGARELYASGMQVLYVLLSVLDQLSGLQQQGEPGDGHLLDGHVVGENVPVLNS